MAVIGCILDCHDPVRRLQITHEILRLIAELDEFMGAWPAPGTLAAEYRPAFRRCHSHQEPLTFADAVLRTTNLRLLGFVFYSPPRRADTSEMYKYMMY